MPCSGLITIFVVLCLFRTACPVKCDIGYGQRGLKFQNEILWQRNCKETTYCFEAVTTDINKVVPLIDYPWVSSVVMLRYFDIRSLSFIFIFIIFFILTGLS